MKMKNKTTYTAKRDLRAVTYSVLNGPDKGEEVSYDRIHRYGLVAEHFFGFNRHRLYKWEEVRPIA